MENINNNPPDAELAQEGNEAGIDLAQAALVVWSQAAFDAKCAQVQANDPRVTKWDSGIHVILDDEKATQLGQALAENVYVTEMAIHIGHPMTAFGTTLLLDGIMASHVRSLVLYGSWDRHLDMTLLVRNIKELTINFPFHDTHCFRLAEALNGNTTLEALGFFLDFMSGVGARALSNGLHNSRIRALNCTEVTGRALLEVQQVLYEYGIGHCSTIADLTITGAVRRGWQSLTMAVPKLSSLYIFTLGERLSVADMDLLGDGIRESILIRLRMMQGFLGDNQMQVLFPILGNHLSIEVVGIHYNELGDDAITTFVENWNRESNINELDFSCNKIGIKGFGRLLEAAASHPQLCKVDLGGNIIGYDGLKLVGNAIAGLKLQELGIHQVTQWTPFEDATCKDAVLQESKRAEASKALLEGVRSNFSLQYLNVRSNNLLDSVTGELQVYMEANRKGRRFLWEQTNLPATLWCNFLSRMNPHLVFLFLRELPVVVTMGQAQTTRGAVSL